MVESGRARQSQWAWKRVGVGRVGWVGLFVSKLCQSWSSNACHVAGVQMCSFGSEFSHVHGRRPFRVTILRLPLLFRVPKKGP